MMAARETQVGRDQINSRFMAGVSTSIQVPKVPYVPQVNVGAAVVAGGTWVGGGFRCICNT